MGKKADKIKSEVVARAEKMGLEFNITKSIKTVFKKDEAFFTLIKQNKLLAQDWRTLANENAQLRTLLTEAMKVKADAVKISDLQKKIEGQKKEINRLLESVKKYKSKL